MNQSELKTILEKHSKWLKNEPGGKKADLSEADLLGADLRWANLREANLRGADLRGADLRGANLRGANLRWANLREANLRGANLSGANLCEANLCEANLCGADLSGADLRGANLSGADLRGVDLIYFTFNRHTAYFTFDGKIRIGCHYEPIEWWIKNAKRMAEKEGYTQTEFGVYEGFIKLCEKLQAEKDRA